MEGLEGTAKRRWDLRRGGTRGAGAGTVYTEVLWWLHTWYVWVMVHFLAVFMWGQLTPTSLLPMIEFLHSFFFIVLIHKSFNLVTQLRCL